MKGYTNIYKSKSRSYSKQRANRMLERLQSITSYPGSRFEIVDTLEKKRGKLINKVSVTFQLFVGEPVYTLATWATVKQ